MTFILIDNSDKSNDLQLTNARWRPVASEIVRARIISDERAQTLEHHLCTQVSSLEAIAISEHLSKLLQAQALPHDIKEATATAVARFAASSSGFEVC
ncbi:hypothetical protein [Thalassococcus sp. S3]|uniref:hypothetical protein n=1 Tax=Thalassococcus sp. S3 TaxID=2017482 RepID=UPI00102AFC77|nr:hypothetical protein [Thalassococcus sp. S3]